MGSSEYTGASFKAVKFEENEMQKQNSLARKNTIKPKIKHQMTMKPVMDGSKFEMELMKTNKVVEFLEGHL